MIVEKIEELKLSRPLRSQSSRRLEVIQDAVGSLTVIRVRRVDFLYPRAQSIVVVPEKLIVKKFFGEFIGVALK